MCASASLLQDGWFEHFDPDLVTYLCKFRKYYSDSLSDLLRCFRNMCHHPVEDHPQLSSKVVPPLPLLFPPSFPSKLLTLFSLFFLLAGMQLGIFRFFNSTFPSMFASVYELFAELFPDDPLLGAHAEEEILMQKPVRRKRPKPPRDLGS